MALTDLTRISTSGIATGSTIDSPILRKDVNFRGSQVGVSSILFDSSDDKLNLKDNVKLELGNNPSDLFLLHNGTYSQIAGIGDFFIQSNSLYLKDYTNGHNYLKAVKDGAVDLYHDNDLRFSTTGYGATVFGTLNFSSGGGITAGVVTCTGLDLNGNGDVSGNFVIGGDLTVNGTTTTLDTNLTEVDRIEVGANSNTLAGIAVTQSGSADIVRLYDGSTQVVTVDDTGNVGLGSAIPSAKLDVVGTGIFSGLLTAENGIYLDKFIYHLGDLNTSFGFPNDATDTFVVNTSSSEKFRITSDGKVGIGLTNPEWKLAVYDNDYTGVTIKSNRNTATDNIGGLHFKTRTTNVAYIQSLVDGTIKFRNSSSLTERLRITSDGLVGIGTDNPGTNHKLEILGNASAYATLNVKSQSLSHGSALELGAVDDDDYGQILQFASGSGEGGRMRFTAGGLETMNLRGGKVGINSTIPVTTLDVQGDMSVAYNATHALRFYTQPKNNWSSISNTATDGNANLSFKTSQGEAMYMSYSRLVGIGTNDPSAKLDVYGSGSASVIRARRTDSNGGYNIFEGYSEINNANVFTVSNNGAGYFKGKVGIGTDNPYHTLTVRGANDTTFDNISLLGLSGTDDYNSGNAGAGINFNGKYNSSGNITTLAQISGIKEDTNNGTYDGALTFGVRNDAEGVNIERLRITSAGNVNINGTPPWALTGGNYKNLSISGNDASSSGFLWLGNGAAATNADFDLGRINFCNNDKIVARVIGSTDTSANDDGRLVFYTKETGQTEAERVRIDSAGNVQFGGVSNGGPWVHDGGSANGARQLVDFGSGTANRCFGWGGTNANYANIWTEYSTGDLNFATGLRPNGASTGYVSSYSDQSIGRANIELTLTGQVIFRTAASSTVANGTAVSTLDERLRISKNGQLLHGNSSEDIGWALFWNSASGGADAGTAGNDGAGDQGVNIRSDMGPTHLDLEGTDNFTLKLINGAYSGSGVADPNGTIAKILFNTSTYNGWNSYGAIALQSVGASAAKGEMVFMLNNGTSSMNEKMRIKSTFIETSNDMGMEIYGGTINHPNDSVFYVNKTSNADWAIKCDVTGGTSTDYGMFSRVNNNAAYAIGCNDTSTWRFRVNGAGTIYATNTTVQSISDVRLKENIVDANSQWDDIKALRFRNYKWKEDSGRADGKTYLGLIAQEVEPISPGLVEIDAQTKEDIENNVPDPEYKNVKYSIVWMKAVKALQEAQARIEQLEAKVAALEGS